MIGWHDRSCGRWRERFVLQLLFLFVLSLLLRWRWLLLLKRIILWCWLMLLRRLLLL